MATVEQLIALLRAQKAAGFFSFLRIQEHIDAITISLTGESPAARSMSELIVLAYSAVPLLWWQLLFLGVWLLFLFRGVRWWQKRQLFFLVATLLSLLLLASCVWWQYQQRNAIVAVVQKETPLRSGPDQLLVQMGTLKIGEQGVIAAEYEPRPGESYAKLVGKKKRGWVQKSALGIV